VTRYGYSCEECNVAIYPTTTRAELAWLKDRAHIAREVARHSSGGLEHWMTEGLAFFDDHSGHSVLIIAKK
jgi:hypothetical protein